jgi:hypothetical protein
MFQTGLAAFAESEKGPILSQANSSDPVLQEGLMAALKSIDELRKKNRSTDIDCTNFFEEFNRYRDIEPYLSFFKSIGISATLNDRNGKHYAAFYLEYYKLRAMGFGAFFKNDTLVIVFTTTSASSTQIISFKSALLSGGYL